MRYRVNVELLSPTLIGDRREPSAYFLTSRDFIPGGVLRAAFAKAIKEECPYETGDGRLNWVEFMGGEECSSCCWRGLCKNFGEIRFHHLYKDGARVAPLSAYRCKFEREHPVFDTLLATGAPTCPACKKPGERVGGYLKDGKEEKAKRRLLMRLEVDPYLGVARERQLYALRVLRTGQKFSGLLDVPEGADSLPTDLELRIGAKTTSGLGRAKVTIEKAAPWSIEDLRRRVSQFQEKARQQLQGLAEEEAFFLSFTLLADALPEGGLKAKDEWVDTDVLQQELMVALLPKGSVVAERFAGVIKAYTDFNVYGGYNTAEPGNGRRNASVYVSAGSVFLCKVEGVLDDDLLQSLRQLEERGLGARTEEGYGAVRVCDGFHLNTGGMDCGRK
ncbi:MAG: hypothetical protein ACPLTR_00380 [Thermacetogeniaceae bacterium]